MVDSTASRIASTTTGETKTATTTTRPSLLGFNDGGLSTALVMGLAGSAAAVAFLAYQSYYAQSLSNRGRLSKDSFADEDTSGSQNALETNQREMETDQKVFPRSRDDENKILDDEDGRLHLELPSHIRREIFKEKRRNAQLVHLSMKKPMYDNVTMLDPQGEILCKISNKKAQWYIDKDLAKWVNRTNNDNEEHQKDQFTNQSTSAVSASTIQLCFEPKNRTCKDSNREKYSLSDKRNVCVVCGGTKHHMRHYVVPYAYRCLLPEKYKAHLSHDVVPLCHRCHVECDQLRQERMKHLEESIRSMGNTTGEQFSLDRDLYNIRSCAMALSRWKDKMPQAKIVEYEEMVRSYLHLDSQDNITQGHLQSVIDLEYKKPNANYVPGPVLIVDTLLSKDCTEEGEEEIVTNFIKGWRVHFLQTMEPRYLPRGWSVDSPVIRGRD